MSGPDERHSEADCDTGLEAKLTREPTMTTPGPEDVATRGPTSLVAVLSSAVCEELCRRQMSLSSNQIAASCPATALAQVPTITGPREVSTTSRSWPAVSKRDPSGSC